MNLEEIRNSLTSEINPVLSKNNETKLSSVLVIIFGDLPKILMIKKPITMNYHGGEIAFPGGKISNKDDDLLDTAIRETREETGIIVEREKILGQLEPVTTFLNTNGEVPTFTENDVALIRVALCVEPDAGSLGLGYA